MAAKFSKPVDQTSEPVPTPLAAFGDALRQRRAALGNPVLPRNTGTRRTASKQALLNAIEKAGGNW